MKVKIWYIKNINLIDYEEYNCKDCSYSSEEDYMELELESSEMIINLRNTWKVEFIEDDD